MKTYNERLNEIAEEFVRVRYAECVCLDPVYLGKLIMMHKPLAAIAIKHMAEMYEEGYRNWDGKHDINSLGLQPQKTIV